MSHFNLFSTHLRVTTFKASHVVMTVTRVVHRMTASEAVGRSCLRFWVGSVRSKCRASTDRNGCAEQMGLLKDLRLHTTQLLFPPTDQLLFIFFLSPLSSPLPCSAQQASDGEAATSSDEQGHSNSQGPYPRLQFERGEYAFVVPFSSFALTATDGTGRWEASVSDTASSEALATVCQSSNSEKQDSVQQGPRDEQIRLVHADRSSVLPRRLNVFFQRRLTDTRRWTELRDRHFSIWCWVVFSRKCWFLALTVVFFRPTYQRATQRRSFARDWQQFTTYASWIIVAGPYLSRVCSTHVLDDRDRHQFVFRGPVGCGRRVGTSA
ncbi:unnamed protein product [Protopolystoma xenopodis]|uniref:Uncharacterized protein n=1 Tax=Protopolystoma xenopodis TaxID=117903 RepID=A0A448XRD6_9PLAT|nr:unnamed protein product [Protopolystoma xenopodis]